MKNNFDDIHYPKNIDEILHKNVDEKMIDHIRRANNDYLDCTAQKFLSIETTYRELFANIEKYAKALKQYGIQKGDCVTIALPNIPETIYYFYACNEIGATAYLIDPRSSFKNMVNCINNSNSKLFICEMGNYYAKVAKNTDELPVDNVVVVSPLNTLENEKKLNTKLDTIKDLYSLKNIFEELKFAFNNNNNKKCFQKEFINKGKSYTGNYSAEYDPDIPAIIVNTSGTTGNSIKGTMHSNKSYNLYSNEAQFVTDQLDRGNTYYGYIPYFSMYGSGVGMHVALTYGIIINNIPKFDGKKTLKDIIDSKTNILIGTPNLIEKLTEMYKKDSIDASHVMQYIVGGDNMAPEKINYVNDTLKNLGMKRNIVYGYGATECMPVSTTNHEEQSYVYGSSGMIYPKTYIKIVDPETGKEQSFNQEGEIYVNNETLMMGYLNNPAENRAVLKNIDGKTYYKTGDKGYVVETGHLYLTGRYKRMMKRPDGHQTSPIPIENAVMQCENVKDCAVVGITRKDGMPGVIPTAFVVLDKKYDKEDEEKILNFIANETLKNISGERENALAYVVVDKIPSTINGKTDFNLLQQNKFDDLDFYLVDDVITKEYFVDMNDLKFLNNNLKIKTLNKR